MWVYIGIGVVVVAVVIGFVFNYKRSKAINENGIEADAVVSRVKEIEKDNDDGSQEYEYEYFVKYKTQSGETVEAKLGNPPRFLTEGKQLRVKYLPEKPKYVLMVKQ
ncbi:MAG: DUF3592 domain-containing protein [Clostridia bacterium]|nr:DUF3592 domain-containing protein [Clostridia bacterium]